MLLEAPGQMVDEKMEAASGGGLAAGEGGEDLAVVRRQELLLDGELGRTVAVPVVGGSLLAPSELPRSTRWSTTPALPRR